MLQLLTATHRSTPHTEAKALLGRVAKLNSEMSRHSAPIRTALGHAEPEFVNAVFRGMIVPM